VPRAIPADGSADVTAALNRFIALVPSGRSTDLSIIQFSPRGRYRIEETLLVNDKVDLILEGNGALLFASTVGNGTPQEIANRNHVELRGGSNIVVRNFTILGVNPHPGKFDDGICCQHGIEVAGTQGALITGNQIRNVYGDNVTVQPDYNRTSRAPEKIRVEHNIFEGAGRQGISVVGGSDVWLSANTIDGAGFVCVDLEPDTSRYPINGVRIVGNKLARHGPHAPTIAARGAAPVSNVQILNNIVAYGTLSVSAGSPSTTDRQTDWLIKGNVATQANTDSTAYGYLRFERMDRVTVASNDVILEAGPGQVTWVIATASSGVHVTNNVVRNAAPVLSCVNSADCWGSRNST
jgi:hypothetical protein